MSRRSRVVRLVRGLNTPAGSVVSALSERSSVVRPVSPAKSSTCSALMDCADRSNVVSTASWLPGTRAQSVAATAASSASSTSCVRSKMLTVVTSWFWAWTSQG